MFTAHSGFPWQLETNGPDNTHPSLVRNATGPGDLPFLISPVKKFQ